MKQVCSSLAAHLALLASSVETASVHSNLDIGSMLVNTVSATSAMVSNRWAAKEKLATRPSRLCNPALSLGLFVMDLAKAAVPIGLSG